MHRHVIIATNSDELKQRLLTSLHQIGHIGEISYCSELKQIVNELGRGLESTVIFDKFIIGFEIKDCLTWLECLNERARFLFVGELPGDKYFAYRLYMMNAHGYIWNAGAMDKLESELATFFSRGKFFPREIEDGIRNGDYEMSKEFTWEPTNLEQRVLMSRWRGSSFKNIKNVSEGVARKCFLKATRKTGLDMSWSEQLRFAAELGFISILKGGFTGIN